eukprot:14114.XXX_191352_191495_1 [CDS] Oithona nana genome sequencing.
MIILGSGTNFTWSFFKIKSVPDQTFQGLENTEDFEISLQAKPKLLYF